MAVIPMKYISIMGNVNDLDRVAETYVSRYPIHLEHAISELHNVTRISSFEGTNPYVDSLKTAARYVADLGEQGTASRMTAEQADEVIRSVTESLSENETKRQQLIREKEQLERRKDQIQPFLNLDVPFEKLFRFEFIKFRFGKMPRDSYKKLNIYIKEDMDAFFFPAEMNGDFVWGMYFMPAVHEKEIDALFSSLHFERVLIEDGVSGTPKEAYDKAEADILALEKEQSEAKTGAQEILKQRADEIQSAYQVLSSLDRCYDIRKHAAITKDNYYILVGWMTETDVKALTKELDKDRDVIYILEDSADTEAEHRKPPTKLKNFFLFRPFEMFVKMYGLPDQNELDPTPFVALTYAFLFGMMFGDVGQGAVLLLGGLAVYLWKKMDLAAILSICGIFSVFFGFMYGSFFGYEDTVIRTVWLSPMHGEGTMTVLLTSIGIGALVIMITMLFNIINAIRQKRLGKALFDTNGIAGLVFYVLVVLLATPFVAQMFGKQMGVLLKINGTIVGILLAVSILMIWFREPLEKWVSGKKEVISGSKGMFLMESFFELFEIMLSFVTNSISFVRVGAFALSHAGMMSVVHLLAGAASGSPNWVIMVLGNLLVMGLEGLIVGIQVLRLEFYEIFSRFYSGTGRPFIPYSQKETK